MNYNASYNKTHNDTDEYYISQYINKIENFIFNYGFDKPICFVGDNIKLSIIENSIRDFLIKEVSAWNHLEIYGTLKEFKNRTIYVCCYEPYGEELICVEHKNNNLYFFKNPYHPRYIKPQYIDYLDKYNKNNDFVIF